VKRLLVAGIALQLALLVVVAVLLGHWGDVWWPATVLLFMPRWIWGLPLLVLVPLAARRERRYLAPLGLAALILLGPILDLRVPWRRIGRSSGARDLRVMTYNIGGGDVDTVAMGRMIMDEHVDLVTFQERSPGGAGLGPLRLNSACTGTLCISARFPIATKDARDRSDLAALHGSGGIIRYELPWPHGTLSVTNVHLATVRRGLDALRRQGLAGRGALIDGIAERRLESEIASAWARRGGEASLVMGDFNIPVDSAIYRASWSDWQNAFTVAGFGFGSSKYTRFYGIRIDHVLAGPGWQVLRAWVGPGFGGDHRPMLADLRWLGTAPATASDPP